MNSNQLHTFGYHIAAVLVMLALVCAEFRRQTSAGFGGCNRLGGYRLTGDTLRFSRLAGTMMKCTQGMELNLAFHKALRSTSSWRISGGTLELPGPAASPPLRPAGGLQPGRCVMAASSLQGRRR